MKVTGQFPKTLQEAILYFNDEQVCVQTVAFLRWSDGAPTCPKCGNKTHYWLATQKRWKCNKCYKQFSVKVGTIFEDSPLGLDKWMAALWLIVNCKNGISSHEVAKDLGVTQKSAWFMLHRLRLALESRSLEFKLGSGGGPREVDEAFIGPKPQKMHRERRLKMQPAQYGRSKAVVMGMLNRDSRQVRAQVVPNVKRETLQNEIHKQIEKGATVYSDGYPAHDRLAVKEYIHETVNHVQE